MGLSAGRSKTPAEASKQRKKSPADAGLLVRSECQMMWVTINAMTTTSGTPNNHRMTGIVASAA